MANFRLEPGMGIENATHAQKKTIVRYAMHLYIDVNENTKDCVLGEEELKVKSNPHIIWNGEEVVRDVKVHTQITMTQFLWGLLSKRCPIDKPTLVIRL